jgi:hypothetical protein
MKLWRLFAAAALLAPMAASAKDKAPPPLEPSTHPDWDDVAAQGRTLLISNLFDPQSAQITWSSGFRWGYSKPFIGGRTWGWIACGAVNAKNRMGGYVGAQGFWVLAVPSGMVSYGMTASTVSSCDFGGGPPVNPELVNVSAPTTAAGPVTGVADELRKLAELRDQGIITPAEFEKQKAKLLAR